MKKKICAIAAMLCVVGAVSYAQSPDVHYPLDEAVTETTENGSIVYKEGLFGYAAHFSDNAYISLPSGLVSSLNDFTVSAWVKPDAIANWMRVFDFGTSNSNYMFLTLDNGSGKAVYAITTNGAGNEQKITAPSPFRLDTWMHIAITQSGNTAIMYANGTEIGRNEAVTLKPSALGSTTKNYLAKSQYDDPYFNGSIDDFRIYSSALAADEIAKLAAAANEGIVSAENVEISTIAFTRTELPAYVNATFANGSTREVEVTWEEYDPELNNTDGTFSVNGKINGSDICTAATITVTSDSIIPSVSAVSTIREANGTATAKYQINNDSEITEAYAYIAAYANGKLEAVSMSKIDNLADGEYSVSVNVPSKEDVLVKTYLWDKDLKPITAATERNVSNPYGSSFEVSEVTLSDGIFKTSQDTGKEVLLSLDVDRLLAPVALSTGASTDTSKYYGGWESYNYRGYGAKGITGHSLGHWLSAASTMYAVSNDAQLKEKLDYAVSKMAEYQAVCGTGFVGGWVPGDFEKAIKSGNMNVSGFDLSGYWVPWYSIHKIYQGLVDAYTLTGNEQALEVVCKFADWAKNLTDNLTDAQFASMLGCEYGGMNEVMCELYTITGNEDYFNLALRFCESAILDPLAAGEDRLQGKHANTQIPKVIGAAAVYEEDETYENYRKAAEFFYDTVVNNRSYCIGGNSNYEHFGTVTEEVLGTQTCETCNTYNMMRLAEHLYAWKHDASYMDYYEKALFNHILASQDPESGMKTYFMSTTPGHFKVYSTLENSFWCCVGSGMENPGRYTRNIYYQDGNDFYVNQFISSSVTWAQKGLTISQQTNYPYEDTTVITIDKGNAEAAINVRIPAWIADAATITINDEEPVSVTEAGYCTLSRTWNEGDTITVKLPMGLHIYTARDSVNKVSFMYGPVVLAGALGTQNFPSSDIQSDHTALDNHTRISVPDLIVADKNPDTFITVSDLSKLEFTLTAGDNTITLLPYFDIHHQRYSLYWNLYGESDEIVKDEFSEALDAVTIDTVRPGEQQPEVDHAMENNNSFSGYFDGLSRSWRDARGEGGFFSYEMEVDSSANNYVMALYWGSDVPFSADGVSYTRDFEIVVDDTVIDTQVLNNSNPNNPMYMYYEIPAELVKDKTSVVVKFRTKGANTAAGGVFEVRTTTGVVDK